MRGYYAARASEYDQVYRKPERQADIAWLKAWLPTCFRDSSTLDVAAGTGFWSQDIATAARRLVAIDASAETLAIAGRRLQLGNVGFVVGDVYSLPFRTGSFTAAFAGFWFSHVPKALRQTFLRDLARVTQPGSTVVLLDNRYVEGSNHPISETDGDGNTYQVRRLNNGTEHRVLKNFPGRDELCDLIGESGFELQHVELTYYWAVKYRTAGC